MRILNLYVAVINQQSDGEPYPVMINITKAVADALGWKMATRATQPWGIVVNGVGMDMHFYTVYQLSRALYDDGYHLNHTSL